MTQHVQSATRAQNLLDLLVTDPSLSVTGVRVDDAGLVSDHRRIAGNISVHRRAVRAVPKSFRPIRKIDTDEFEQSLWNSELFSSPATTVDGFAEQLERVVVAELDRVARSHHSSTVAVDRRSRSHAGCHKTPSTRNVNDGVSSVSGGVHSSTLTASRTVKSVVVPTSLSTDRDTTSPAVS